MKALDNVVIISQGLLKKFLEMEKQWPLKIDLGSVFLEMVFFFSTNRSSNNIFFNSSQGWRNVIIITLLSILRYLKK